jgi:hypothetical protein
MGGPFRDDHPGNIQATHYWCNGEKDQPGWTSNGRSAVMFGNCANVDSLQSVACQLCAGFRVTLFAWLQARI